MIDLSVGSLMSLYQFNLAFLVAAFERLSTRVAKEPALAKFVKATLASLIEARDRDLLARQQAKRAEVGNPLSVELDRKIDKTLGAIPASLTAYSGREEDEGRLAAAEAFVADLFPKGLGAVTSLRFLEEVTEAEAIVESALKQPELVRTLALGPVLKRISRLCVDQRKALDRADEQTLSSNDTRADVAKGNEALAQYVVQAAGKYFSSSKEHLAARRRLLGPILELNAEIGESFKRQQGVPVVPAPVEPSPQ